MKPYGTYKIRYQRDPDGLRSASPRCAKLAERVGARDARRADPIERALHRVARAERRTQRIVDSICDEIRGGGERSTLRIRRVFVAPREIFRVELERPDLGYQRTTLLGREALEALLESDGVRNARSKAARVGAALTGRRLAAVVPGAGLEPARLSGQAILSRPRLPIPPPGPRLAAVYTAPELRSRPCSTARRSSS